MTHQIGKSELPQAPTTLLYISLAQDLGGGDFSTANLAANHSRNGNLTVTALVANHRTQKLYADRGIDATLVPIARNNRLSQQWTIFNAIQQAIRAHRPRVIISSTGQAHAAAILAAKLGGCSCVIWIRGYRYLSHPGRHLLLFSNHVFFPSQHLAERQNTRAKSSVVPNMFNIPSPQSSAGPVRDQLGIGPDIALFAFGCRFIQWKGIHVLIEACAIARTSSPGTSFTVVIAGDTSNSTQQAYKDSLETRINELDLHGTIRLIGWVPSMEPLISESDAVVSCSLSSDGGPESFGRTLVEAWVHKKPVISSSCGHPGDMIDDQRDGLLVPENDPQRLADALLALAQDPELRKQLGEAGYQKAKTRFSTTQVMQQYEQVILPLTR